MRASLRFACAALVPGLLGAAGAAHGQTADDALRFTHRLPAVGARFTGMAGASAAGVADYSALFTNPAGLAFLQKSQVVGGLGIFNALDEASVRFGAEDGLREASTSNTGLSSLGYAAKAPTARGSLVFAIGYSQTNDFDRLLSFGLQNDLNSITDFFMPLPGEFEITREPGEDDLPNTPDDQFDVAFNRPISRIAFETFAIDFDRELYEQGADVPFLPAVTRGTVEQNDRVIEEGRTGELSFGGAAEAAKGVMVGLSANVSFGGYHYRRIFEEEDVNNDNDGTLGTTDFDFLSLTEDLDVDLKGINLRGGVSAEAIPGLRLGFTLETPTVYSIQEQYETVVETFFDNNDSYVYGGEPGDDLFGNFDYRIYSPWRLGGGAAYRVGRTATIAADVEYVDWSQMRFDADSDERYFESLNDDLRENLQPVLNTRFGFELGVGPLALRAGFAVQPDARRESIDDLDRDRSYYSAGLGYRFNEQFQVDVGWMQERFDDRYLPYAEVDDAPVVDEQVRRNKVAIGLRLLF